MTPAKAIKFECKFECMGGRNVICLSKICKLKDKSLPPLQRIKRHCLDCVETRQEVGECSHICYLHPYRFGHNPRQKGIGNPRFIKKPQRNDVILGVNSSSELVGSGLGR